MHAHTLEEVTGLLHKVHLPTPEITHKVHSVMHACVVACEESGHGL